MEERGERRESMKCERDCDWLSSACVPTRPATTQVCVLDQNVVFNELSKEYMVFSFREFVWWK